MLWFLVLISVNINGTVSTQLHWPTKPQFNSEKECDASGQAIADKLQLELGTSNSKVFWACKSVSYSDIANTIPTN